MTIEQYQQYVKEGSSSAYTVNLAMLGVIGELGELADVMKKAAIYNDMTKFEAKYGMSVPEKLKDECSDVLWQLVNLFNLFGFKVGEVIDYNVAKLNARHNGSGKTANDGGKR